MSEGFSEEKIEVAINKDEVKNLLKKYKKVKKYMRSHEKMTLKELMQKDAESILQEAKYKP